MEITKGYENRPNAIGCEATIEGSIVVIVVQGMGFGDILVGEEEHSRRAKESTAFSLTEHTITTIDGQLGKGAQQL